MEHFSGGEIKICRLNIFTNRCREAKQEMRKQYCTEVDEPGAPVESCDVDEITTAKEWT